MSLAAYILFFRREPFFWNWLSWIRFYWRQQGLVQAFWAIWINDFILMGLVYLSTFFLKR